MSEYLAPGVYIEEISIGAKPIEGVSTSTAAFLGQTERGPVDARLVTSFEQFKRLYGGYINSNLAYAVDGFFGNGGQRCYIGRIVHKDAVAASMDLTTKKEGDGSAQAIKVSAIGPGSWGSNIAVRVGSASLTSQTKPGLFRLTVAYWKNKPDASTPTSPDDKTASVIEVYDNLSSDATSSDYHLKRINGVSNLITLSRDSPYTGETPDILPQYTFLSLTGQSPEPGVDLADFQGSSEPGKRTGLGAFEELDDISLICVPDESTVAGITPAIVTHCEKMNRFAIIQASQSAGDISSLRPPQDSKYAAFYYPWISILDPVTSVYRLIPPGGHIAGVYARSDQERGVHKAPANEVLRGVADLQIKITKGEQDILNPRGVNCIRAFTGRGIRIWGARTASSDPSWKYVNIRRLFTFIEKSIDTGTQWVVFEPNDEKLWARVKQTINQFLTGVWKDGALMGLTQDEAFFVKCDRTTMTQDDIDNGRLIILIGVAPVKPAEFVVFRIAQVAKGSAISE